MKDRVIDKRTGMTEEEAKKALVRAPLFRTQDGGPYFRIRNLNAENPEDPTSHPAFEVGWRCTF